MENKGSGSAVTKIGQTNYLGINEMCYNYYKWQTKINLNVMII